MLARDGTMIPTAVGVKMQENDGRLI
jgi:hypothetical protein